MEKDSSMNMPNKALYDQVKEILKRVPGVQQLINLKNGIVYKIIRTKELSSFIKENKVVTFPSYTGPGNDVTVTHELIHEVVKEWLDLYGIVHIGKTTLAAIDHPASSVLLYAPMALLKIPASYEEFIKQVRHETRREIKLAEREGYEFKEFVWNDHLDEIYEINTSKEIRQSLPMLDWYGKPVQPRHHPSEELKYRKYYGEFKDGKLYAYFHFWLCGDIAIGKHIMGHAQHLKYGIMNALIAGSVREYVGNPQIRWLHYGTGLGGSLGLFKRHIGFQEYAVLLDLNRDPELLKYSKRTVKTLWSI
jgi:hypothetical protein